MVSMSTGVAASGIGHAEAELSTLAVPHVEGTIPGW